MMKKEPESWDAAWNDLDRAFSISCKPTAKRVPKGYVFDEDKSVRWNAEQVESHNVEIQKEVSEKQKARSLAINKATDAIIALYGNYNCMYRTMDRGQFFNGHWGGEPKNGTCAKVLAWTELPLYNPTGGDPMTKQQLVD